MLVYHVVDLYLRTDIFFRKEEAAENDSGCLHSPILKALPDFQEKTAHKSSDMQFFLQNVQNEIFKIFKMFKKTWNKPEQPAELTQK